MSHQEYNFVFCWEGAGLQSLCCSLDSGIQLSLHSLHSWHISLSWSTKHAVVFVTITIIMVFEIGSHYIALGVLDLAIQTRLDSNSQTQEIHLPLPLRCWNQRCMPPHPAKHAIYCFFLIFYYVKILNFQNVLLHLIFLFPPSVLGAGHDTHLI